MSRPTLTIVTISLNDARNLEKTIQSVINQSFRDFEYLIIDGGSSDDTVEVLKKYEHEIDFWVSEPDHGIYDAMNKGLTYANGIWINFMNSGDTFISPLVLQQVFTSTIYSDTQIIYGSHQVEYPSGRKRLASAGAITSLWKGSRFCHQSVFVRTNFHKNRVFSLSKPIVADFDFFYAAWKSGARFQKIDSPVACIASGGVSDIKRIDSILGQWQLVEKNSKVNLYFCYRLICEIFKELIKKRFF